MNNLRITSIDIFVDEFDQIIYWMVICMQQTRADKQAYSI